MAEAKAHAKIEIDYDDALISAMIARARQMVENATGRALITQTWTATLDRWADSGGASESDSWPFSVSPTTRRIELEHLPVASITSLVVDGVTIASTNYALRGDELYIKTDVVDSTAELGGGIVITFVAGYGAAAAVPEAIKIAILMLVAHLYEAREATSPQGIYYQVTPFAVDTLLLPYTVFRL